MCKHAPIGIAFGRVRPFLILRVRVLGMRVLGMVRSGHQLANFPSLRSQARARWGGAVLHSTFSVRSWQGGGAFKHHGGGRTWVLGNASSLSFATGNMCDPHIPSRNMRDSYVSIPVCRYMFHVACRLTLTPTSPSNSPTAIQGVLPMCR